MVKSKIVHFPEAFKREIEERASLYELEFHGCAECVLIPFLELWNVENEQLSRAASALTGGLGRMGKTCGALLGGALVLGSVFGRSDPQEGVEGLIKAQKATYDLVKKFETEFGSTECYSLTQCDLTNLDNFKNFIEGPKFKEVCCTIVPRTAGMVCDIIQKGPIGW